MLSWRSNNRSWGVNSFPLRIGLHCKKWLGDRAYTETDFEISRANMPWRKGRIPRAEAEARDYRSSPLPWTILDISHFGRHSAICIFMEHFSLQLSRRRTRILFTFIYIFFDGCQERLDDMNKIRAIVETKMIYKI